MEVADQANTACKPRRGDRQCPPAMLPLSSGEMYMCDPWLKAFGVKRKLVQEEEEEEEEE